MLLRSRCWRLHIGTAHATAERVTAKTASRQRRFAGLASSYGSLGTRDGRGTTADARGPRTAASAFPPFGRSVGCAQHDAHANAHADNSHHGGGVTPDRDGFVSQRQRHRRMRADEDNGEQDTSPNVAGALFSPLPKKYGFYDGIDEHALEPQTLSREARRERLYQALAQSAVSVVEVTEASEADMDLGGLPASEYHGQAGWTTVSTHSSLYNNILARDVLESRQRTNTWSAARRRHGRGDSGPFVRDTEAEASGGHATDTLEDAAEGVPLSAARRVQRQDDGQYNDMVEGELLAPVTESIGQPRSVYGMRKLFVQGLVGYQGIISRAEESTIAEELLHLLQDPRAAYVAEETRYCVNLYEKELGVPGKDTLAFALSSAPTLQRVLHRFFLLGFIPSIPNVCQISEMTGTFSGYPVHRKPASIGSYFGILNLVSTSMLYMQHVDCPWYPRVHMAPRSLFVFSDPCLAEYKTGYKWTHQPFHTFDYATRVSKDYRIEVMFATVEVEHQKSLYEAVQLTDYATRGAKAAPIENEAQRQGAEADGPASQWQAAEHTDALLQQLRKKLHSLEKSPTADDGAAQTEALPLDGHKLREALQARHLIGRTSHTFDVRGGEAAGHGDDATAGGPSTATATPPRLSPAQRRLAALKDRYAAAEAMRQQQSNGRPAAHHDVGPRLIRGHAPADDAGKL